MVLLGTGAAAPFKYRTVSSIYVALDDGGGVILDAGETAAFITAVITNTSALYYCHHYFQHALLVLPLVLPTWPDASALP